MPRTSLGLVVMHGGGLVLCRPSSPVCSSSRGSVPQAQCRWRCHGQRFQAKSWCGLRYLPHFPRPPSPLWTWTTDDEDHGREHGRDGVGGDARSELNCRRATNINDHQLRHSQPLTEGSRMIHARHQELLSKCSVIEISPPKKSAEAKKLQRYEGLTQTEHS